MARKHLKNKDANLPKTLPVQQEQVQVQQM